MAKAGGAKAGGAKAGETPALPERAAPGPRRSRGSGIREPEAGWRTILRRLVEDFMGKELPFSCFARAGVPSGLDPALRTPFSSKNAAGRPGKASPASRRDGIRTGV